MEREPTQRRPLLKAMVGGGIALGTVAAGSRVFLSPDGLGSSDSGVPALELSADGGSDVRALEVRLGDDLLPKVGANRWGTTQLQTSKHSMLGFTWRDQTRRPYVQVRSRSGGVWQPWVYAPTLHDVPDPDTAESVGVLGTQLLWIGDADGIQVRVTGDRPNDFTLVLLYPARRAADQVLRPAPSASTYRRGEASTDLRTTKRPSILSRKDWGADESWRTGSPTYISTIEQVHVHHTVSSNDYSQDDVPAMIRGMYRYHTKNLGWSDIGYNFLVDRFGRTWVGRAGGAARPVRGAHTLGFNASSTGVSAIGNFDQVAPSSAVIDAIAKVAAWKLTQYDHRAAETTEVTSEGSDKYRSGQRVRLPRIDGHRDTNKTACPGGKLYAQLPTIRARTEEFISAAQEQPMRVTRPSQLRGEPVLGQRLKVRLAKVDPADAQPTYAWFRDGAAIPGATAKKYRPTADDIGARLSVRVRLTKAGFRTTEELLEAPDPVKVATEVLVRKRGRMGRAIVRVQVVPIGIAASSLEPVTGPVMISVSKRKKRTTVTHGRAVGRFIGLSPRRHQIVVKYKGNDVYLPSRVIDQVRVRR